MPLQSKDRANVVFCYHPHFEADFSAFSGAAVPEMRILPDCERFFLITRTSSPQCGNKRLCQSTWLFCFSNILKTYALSPSFPPAGSVVGGFYWLFLWNFKEIKHQPFPTAQPYGKTLCQIPIFHNAKSPLRRPSGGGSEKLLTGRAIRPERSSNASGT